MDFQFWINKKKESYVNVYMDHETSPLLDMKMFKTKPMCKLMDT